MITDRGSPRLIHITTVPLTLGFLRGQVGFMKSRGYQVRVISSPGPLLDAFAARERVRAVALPMERRIAPGRDLVALGRLWRRLRRLHPQIVHAHTPKGGLLGTLAAWLAGVPVRIYHIHGLPLMTAGGIRRRLLRRVEWLCCRFAGQVYCVSHSLRDVVLAEGLCPPGKVKVLLGGSINGVDAEGRFDPAWFGAETRRQVRDRHGIPHEAPVVGYVGRIVGDKGITELVAAWQALRGEFPDLHLLVVGPFESQDPIPPAVDHVLRTDPACHLTGQVEDPAPEYAAMDVLVLPSYREGLGYTLIEAGAMGLPVVASRIPGCVDAVDDGRTGLLVPPRDAPALAGAIRRYLADADLRKTHGAAGRARVLAEFRSEAIWDAMAAEYARLLREANRRPARSLARGLKRLIDVTAAAAGLVLLAPLLAAVSLAILIAMGRPVLFRQVRPGRGGVPFTLVKFRTMRAADDPDGQPLPDARRLTRLGRLLRATSLDELPQLWNVLNGDLSLVGPRPLLMDYLPLYTSEQSRRHEVAPGITGWAQVHGRNAISWEQKFAHDVWYVDHWSLGLDLKILALTARKVLRREGVSAAGEATTTRFQGSRSSRELEATAS
jgi:lipopolysaccharide/colanic/teichoic acid biosynthesis glycosyltransferase